MSRERRPAGLDRDRLIAHLRSPSYRPSTTRQLMAQLGVPQEERAAFRRLLARLEEEEMAVGRRGRWHAAATGDALVEGEFLRHPRGFGFVRPDRRAEEDVYLSAAAAAGLMHGDRVRVRILRVDARGRREGRPVEVLREAPRRATGVVEIRGREARVFPYEERIARQIRIEAGGLGGAQDGVAVGVILTRLPDEEGEARGRIVEVLGHPDEPGTDIEIIIRKHGLRQEWPAEVEEAVEGLTEPDAAELRRREDFTTVPTVTIDGETAKDFDDAVSVERLERGWRLRVHIADVAHYVRQGEAIDREALARGTSVYFPGRAVPMLPERLSNDLCSLKPQVPRLVQSAILDLDRHGTPVAVRFADGVIRSAERMTYRAVGSILRERDEALRERYAALVPRFEEMAELCGLLRARRRERGSIDFDLPEPEIVLNARGEMTGVFPSERTIAHQMIEEFMLAANEAVASYLFDRKVPSLYRVHEEPEPVRLEAFDEVLRGLGYALPRPLEAIEPRHLQELLDLVEGRPEERFVSRLALLAMQQARYDPRNLGHFGLAAARYTHFTSPIRRYPDLVVHRVLREVRHGGLREGDPEADRLRSHLPEIAQQSSRTERAAEEAERELEEWKKMTFMGERLGEEFHGFISGVAAFGMFVQLEEFFVEGLVHVSSLADDRYRYEERGHLLRGQESGRVYRLGDRIEVRLVRVDHFLHRMDLEIVGKPVVRRARGGARRGKGRRRAARPR